MASGEAESATQSVTTDNQDTPLRAIIDTPLTDSLVNGIFQQQNNDGSFPATAQLGESFNVDFDLIKRDLNAKGLDPSTADEIHRLISTASILFYFLYHSQKTTFPVDLHAIKQFVSKARAELEGVRKEFASDTWIIHHFSSTSVPWKDEPIMQTYIDKGELAVKYVITTREKYAEICKQLNLSETTWESYIQHLMGLDEQQSEII